MRKVFSNSSNNNIIGNSRKGGLIALAATAIGLSNVIIHIFLLIYEEAYKYIPQLVPPVIKCFVDQDTGVRYYACESLYNIAKIARGNILIYFNEIFDHLCKVTNFSFVFDNFLQLAADPDTKVRNGAQLLDRLIKDIVTESEGKMFNVEKFIPLLQVYIFFLNEESNFCCRNEFTL